MVWFTLAIAYNRDYYFYWIIMQRLTFTQPDDWHLHVREGDHMISVIAATTRCFARAVIMPNLKPPVTTVSQALAYRERICNVLSPDVSFTP